MNDSGTNPIRVRWRRGLVLGFIGASLLIGAATYLHLEREREKARVLELARDAAPDVALPSLMKCLERHPDDPDLLKATVELLIRSEAPIPEIERHLNHLLAVRPNDFEPHLIRARLYFAFTQYSEAFDSAKRCVELAPDREESRHLHASLALKLGAWDEAVTGLRYLQSMRSRLYEPLSLARAELARGRRMEARQVVEEELRRDSGSFQAGWMLANIEFEDGEWEAALRRLDSIDLQQPSERQSALFLRAACLERLGRPEDARRTNTERQALQDAIHMGVAAEQRPDDSALQIRAAKSWLAAGDPQSARRLVEQAIARNGVTRALLENLAQVLEASGEKTEAARLRRESLRLP